MQKRTKITATIGPSSDSEEMIEKLINAGVNIFRFNFKHNEVDWHGQRIQRVKEVAKRMDAVVGTLIDLQGPEIRIRVPSGEIPVNEGDTVILATELPEGQHGMTIPYPEVISALTEGQEVFIDDGAVAFSIEESGEQVKLKCLNRGMIHDRKTMNIPGLLTPLPVLVERDYDGLSLTKDYGVDFIALSFVRTADDVETLREEMKKREIDAQIVSKIEAKAALDNLDDIINATDAIMVARGDLGVEVPIEQVPYYQKIMIKKCIEKGKPVITATQMLQSMIKSPFPTRAEISDVANAVYDLSDSVMLSGETASGSYPLEVVHVMAKTALYNENELYTDRRRIYNYETEDIGTMICNSAYAFSLQCLAKDEHIVGFLVFTQTGRTAKMLSRYRPHLPIYAFSESEIVRDALSIQFGVFPFKTNVLHDHFITKEEIHSTIDVLKSRQLVNSGDRLILVYGDARAESGSTDTLRIVQVK
jgi:pyruvate kinase